MTEPLPQKIQMIKEVREMTGLGLGHAKMLVDTLGRKGGPLEVLVTRAQSNPTVDYDYPSIPTLPDLTTAPRFTTASILGGSPQNKPETPSADLASLTERVERIERWIQSEER